MQFPPPYFWANSPRQLIYNSLLEITWMPRLVSISWSSWGFMNLSQLWVCFGTILVTYSANTIWVSQVIGFLAMVETITSPPCFVALLMSERKRVGLSTCSITSIEVTMSNSWMLLLGLLRYSQRVQLKQFKLGRSCCSLALCSTASRQEVELGSTPTTSAPSLARLLVRKPAPHPTSSTLS